MKFQNYMSTRNMASFTRTIFFCDEVLQNQEMVLEENRCPIVFVFRNFCLDEKSDIDSTEIDLGRDGIASSNQEEIR